MKKNYVWIHESGGQIAIGGRPSLQLIEKLKAEHCTIIVTLLRESEKHIALEIGSKAKELEIDWEWLPLSASSLPTGDTLEKVKVRMEILEKRLKEGARIFIHCAAGLHRTGAFTYGLLRFLGNSVLTSKEKIAQMRPITMREVQEKHLNWGEQFAKDSIHYTIQKMEKDCVFCKIIDGKLPASVVYSDEDVLAIMDIQPINIGHVLVMPKQCYKTLQEVPAALSQKLFEVVTRIEKSLWDIAGITCEGTNILQNNGSSAWQEVHHVHFHIIPRFAGDGFKIKYQAKHPAREELDEMAKNITANFPPVHVASLPNN